MFLAFLGENGSVKCNQTQFDPRLHKPILKVVPMYSYIIAIRYISGKVFSQTISCIKYGFQIASDAKNSNIFCKCNYDGQRFQVFT